MSCMTFDNHMQELPSTPNPLQLTPLDAPPSFAQHQTLDSAISGQSVDSPKLPLPPLTLEPNASAGSSIPQLSASTEEIVKRINANASAHTGAPGWEAARQQVLEGMITSDKLATPTPSTPAKRGRGGTRPGSVNSRAGRGSAGAGRGDATLDSRGSNAPARRRGFRRGRGRGRGGKRKRPDDDSGSGDDSDISSSYTPSQTQTKFGRNVNRPAQFAPPMPSPAGPTKRRRGPRRAVESSVCKICQRGASPSINMIVFCSGCNVPYHQYCHDPPIDADVVLIPEKDWFCAACSKPREGSVKVGEGLTSGSNLTAEEKRLYFSSLPSSTLVSLLVYASTLHPSLPLFGSDVQAITSQLSGSNPPAFDLSSLPATKTSDPAQLSHIFPAVPNTTISTSNSIDKTAPPPTISIAPAPADPPSQHLEAESDLISDQYDGYDTDPPAHYPKPGNGLARTLPPESEDLQWLIDDNFEVFEHVVYKTDGMNGAEPSVEKSHVEGVFGKGIT